MGRLDNKVAIITGGAGGIGLQAGRLFAQEGAKVLLVDLNEDALKEAVRNIGSDAVRYCAADVTQPDHTQRYIQAAVEQFGGSISCLPTPVLRERSNRSQTTRSTCLIRSWPSMCGACG